MGRRYYCDFCEKSFADNVSNRRNHLNGVQHRALKKLHYDSLQDPQVILSNDASKKPCRQFHQNGDCRFGGACKYSHLTQEDRERLKTLVATHQDSKKRKLPPVLTTDPGKHLAEWLSGRKKPASEKPDDPSTRKDPDSEEDSSVNLRRYNFPSVLNGLTNLPVSILPPEPESLLNVNLVEWG